MKVGDLVQVYAEGAAARKETDRLKSCGVLIEKRFPYNWLIINEDGSVIDRHQAYLEVINGSR